MTRGDVPGWAKKRACELANAVIGNSFLYRESHIGLYGHGAITALALHIAQHEDPPVDPLLLEARNIAAKIGLERGYPGDWAEECKAGDLDNCEYVIGALAGLRRGMELAKEGK